MNTQEYISSGIVESYVLGLAAAEEAREFEKACELYPEVLQARIAFEIALEKQAMENAIVPSPQVKEKWLEAVHTNQAPVIPPVRRMRWLNYAAAACLVLLAGSIYMNISLSKKNKELQNNYDNMLAHMNDMKKDMHVLQQNPSIKMASMKGMDASPQSYATVYWDTTSHDVYLLANNLPVPADDKQYQLWAIFNGKPVDLGVFDIKKEKLLIQAKNAQGAEAFAITLEKKGGNPTPQGAMYVMGKL